jgi:hypothetical protein
MDSAFVAPMVGHEGASGHDLSRAETCKKVRAQSLSSTPEPNYAAVTAIRADRERGFAFTTISTSCPSATKNRISRSTE